MDLNTVPDVAMEIMTQIAALTVRNTPSERAVRKEFSRRLKQARLDFMHSLAMQLLGMDGFRWIAYELIQDHKPAFERLGAAQVERLGQGIDSWWTVDSFARTVSGPAWRNGQVPDELILKWARSADRWWRRAALVSTVALNVGSRGGKGDARRTFQVCRLLVNDHDDMVVKAMSWALRELVPHDARAVQEFLDEHDHELAARVKREVRNKLRTGLKNSSRRGP